MQSINCMFKALLTQANFFWQSSRQNGQVLFLQWLQHPVLYTVVMSSGTILHCVLLSLKWILNTFCNLWGYLHDSHFGFPECDRLPVDCLLCKITDMEQNVSCSWSITLPWNRVLHAFEITIKSKTVFWCLFKLFQLDGELQNDLK